MSIIKTSHSCSILPSSTNTKYNNFNNNNGRYFSFLNNEEEEDEDEEKIDKKNNDLLIKQQRHPNEFYVKSRSFSTSRLYNRNFING